jgi:hypothetical protein
MSQPFVWGFLPNVVEGKTQIALMFKRMASLMRERLEGMAVVAFFPQTRAQQKIYNSALNDLAEQCQINGEPRDAVAWKRFIMATLYEHTHSDPDYADDWKAIEPLLFPDMDGDGVHIIALSTKPLTRNLAAVFLNLCHSFGDERGVKWKPTSLGRGAEAANDAVTPRAEGA